MELTRRQAALILAISYGLFFAPALLNVTGVPYYRDHLVTNLPHRAFVHDSLMKGELPFWFPHEGLGVPVVGQIATGNFHPLNLALFWLPPAFGEKAVLLLAYLFGLLGAYRASRAQQVSRNASILTAWAFGFGGYALGVSSIIAYALSFNALPWVLWAAMRLHQKLRLKDIAVLAGVTACVFLAGDALGFALCSLLCGCVFVAKPSLKTLGAFALAGLWAASLTLVELLPATVIAKESVRNLGTLTGSMAFTWSTHPLRLLELVVPGLIPDEARADTLQALLGGGSAVFCTTLFMGAVLPAALATGLVSAPSRTTRAAAVLGVIAVLLALGGHLGLLGVLQKAVSIFSRFRYPERYLALAWAAMLFVAPFGFERILKARSRMWVGVNAGVAGLAIFLMLPGTPQQFAALKNNTLSDALVELIANAWFTEASRTLVVCLLAIAVLQLRFPLRFLSLAALLFIDLWRGNAHHLPLVDASVLQPSPLTRAVNREQPNSRVFNVARTEWASGVTLPGRELWARGTLSKFKASATYLNGVAGLNSNLGATQVRHALLFGSSDELVPRYAPFFNGCNVVVDQRDAAAEDAVDAETGLALHAVPCWPKALLVSAVNCGPDAAVKFAKDQLRLDEPRICWEGPEVTGTPGTVKWLEKADSHFKLETDASTANVLFISNDFIPGWSAMLDGQPADIRPALLTGQGLAIPPGKHVVELRYAPPRIVAGATLSLLGWAAILLALAAPSSRRRPQD